MKKITSIMAMLLLAMMPFALTSCDEDDEIAALLDGTWEGKMYVYKDHDGGKGQPVKSEISFHNKELHNARGNGYWVDHYGGTRGWGHDYYACKFTFKVRGKLCL